MCFNQNKLWNLKDDFVNITFVQIFWVEVFLISSIILNFLNLPTYWMKFIHYRAFSKVSGILHKLTFEELDTDYIIFRNVEFFFKIQKPKI
jgi:hypothetical protein